MAAGGVGEDETATRFHLACGLELAGQVRGACGGHAESAEGYYKIEGGDEVRLEAAAAALAPCWEIVQSHAVHHVSELLSTNPEGRRNGPSIKGPNYSLL